MKKYCWKWLRKCKKKSKVKNDRKKEKKHVELQGVDARVSTDSSSDEGILLSMSDTSFLATDVPILGDWMLDPCASCHMTPHRSWFSAYQECIVESGAISWISRLQRCTALSTTEAEYIAATEACKEAIWLGRLVSDLGIDAVPTLHSDSMSAIQLAKNPVFHAKTKHIEVRYHFIRGVVEDRSVDLVKISTDINPADLLTKSLTTERFAFLRRLMGVG